MIGCVWGVCACASSRESVVECVRAVKFNKNVRASGATEEISERATTSPL